MRLLVDRVDGSAQTAALIAFAAALDVTGTFQLTHSFADGVDALFVDLRENTLSASDLSRIQNALTFLSPLCRDTREAHKDMMGVTLKTDALLRASR